MSQPIAATSAIRAAMPAMVHTRRMLFEFALHLNALSRPLPLRRIVNGMIE
jgi:hypothetical protein